VAVRGGTGRPVQVGAAVSAPQLAVAAGNVPASSCWQRHGSRSPALQSSCSSGPAQAMHGAPAPNTTHTHTHTAVCLLRRRSAILAHPFLRGVADGSLEEESFFFYLVQDELYLR
jgi:hypothetical protein